MHIRTRTHMHAHVCTRMHTCAHTLSHTDTHAHKHACTDAHTCTDAHAHTHMHTHTYTQNVGKDENNIEKVSMFSPFPHWKWKPFMNVVTDTNIY